MPSISKLLGRSKTQRHSTVPEISQNSVDTSRAVLNRPAIGGFDGNPTAGRSNRRATFNVYQNTDSFRGPAELNGWTAEPIVGQPQLARDDSTGRRSDASWNVVPQGPVQPKPAPVAPPPPYFQGCGHIHEWSTYGKAEINMIESQQNCSIDAVRRLRGLIRERYALDLELWDKRNTRKGNHRMIMPKCKKADEVLQEIYWIVNSWEERSFNDEEWEMVKNIKACLQTQQPDNEPAYWQSLPPWARVQEERNRR